MASAKVSRALGMRILNAKKSKYYHIALQRLMKAKELYLRAGKDDIWKRLVIEIKDKHGRKYSFIEDFEELVKGKTPESLKPIKNRLKERWGRQIAQ